MKKDITYLDSDPTTAHDVASGFSLGSRIVNVRTGTEWVCFDNSAGLTNPGWGEVNPAYHPQPGGFFGPEQVLSYSASQPAPNIQAFIPMVIRRKVAVSGVALWCTVVGSAGAAIRCGIYDMKDGLPNRVRKDFGAVALDSGTGVKMINNSVVLYPGCYCLSSVLNNAGGGTMPTVQTIATVRYSSMFRFNADELNVGPNRYFQQNFTYAAMADLTASPSFSAGNDGVGMMLIRSV